MIQRTSGRLICRSCGATYHKEFKAPKESGVCDLCGGELYQRDDDKAETVRARLNVYDKQTKPLIDYYKVLDCYYEIDGSRSMEEVHEQITDSLKKASK